jgi:1-acyl-sn-glycerol-3-phosphate acyltransferase
MQPFFTGSAYDTPENTPRLLLDRLFLNSRWYFVGGYISVVLKARSLAVKGQYNNEKWAESSFNIVRLIEGCGGRIHLRGLENIHSVREPVVFISNHMSTLETFVFPCIIAPHRNVTYVVKESLMNHAIFGPVMRSRDPIAVSRINPREDFQKVMTKGKELLAKGISVIVFPQTTRTREFREEDFNSMGVKLAKAAGVKAVPVAIKTDFWGNGRILKDLGVVNRQEPVWMEFGEPLSIGGNGKEEHGQIVKFITSCLRQWGVPVS